MVLYSSYNLASPVFFLLKAPTEQCFVERSRRNRRSNFESKQNFNECKEFYVYSQKAFIEGDSRLTMRDSRFSESQQRRMKFFFSPSSSLSNQTQQINDSIRAILDTSRQIEFDLEEEVRNAQYLAPHKDS